MSVSHAWVAPVSNQQARVSFQLITALAQATKIFTSRDDINFRFPQSSDKIPNEILQLLKKLKYAHEENMTLKSTH